MYNIKNDELVKIWTDEEESLFLGYKLFFDENTQGLIICDNSGKPIPKEHMVTICKGLMNFLNNGGVNHE